VQVPTTGGWQTFQLAVKKGLSLPQGTHVLRLVLDVNGVEGVVADFDAIAITPALTSPTLVNGTLATATTLAANVNTTAEQIAPLMSGIEQAHAAFISESGFFSSADRIDTGLLAALYFTRAAFALDTADGPSTTVQNRLQIAASHLNQVNNLMLPGGSIAPPTDSAHGVASAISSPVIGPAETRSSASFAPALAPASLGTIIGDQNQSPLSTKTNVVAQTTGGRLPYEFSGVSVTVGGRAAQVLSVAPARVNFFVPADLPAGETEVIVTVDEGYVSRGTVMIAPVAPGIFTRSGDGTGEAVALNSINLTAGIFDVNSSGLLVQDKRTRLIVFTTGFSKNISDTDTSNSLNILGVPLPSLAEAVGVEARTQDGRVFNLAVEYAGTQGSCPGLDQVNVVLPAALKGAGNVELTLIAAGLRSNTATVNIK
jgi:uncharacterized protein (TIGR03437 family)